MELVVITILEIESAHIIDPEEEIADYLGRARSHAYHGKELISKNYSYSTFECW